MFTRNICDFTGKKGLRESDEAFFKGPVNIVSPSSFRKKNHPECRGTVIFILIAPDYFNLD